MVRVKLIGAGGYGGIGLVELLLRHPEARLVALVDVQGVGQRLSDMWPYLTGSCDLPILAPDAPELATLEVDVTFSATPDGVGQLAAPAELALGRKFIDYSGDFRFDSVELYAEYARRIGRDPVHRAPELLAESVYGVTELHRDEIRRARVVGNPGCFAMSAILGLAPAIEQHLVELEGLICDGKTGVSGAGKKPAPTFHFPERYDNMNAYRLSGHQHVLEIERELGRIAGRDVALTFTPQVVPAVRGILSTLYGRLVPGMTQARVLEAYREAYRERTLPAGQELRPTGGHRRCPRQQSPRGDRGLRRTHRNVPRRLPCRQPGEGAGGLGAAEHERDVRPRRDLRPRPAGHAPVGV